MLIFYETLFLNYYFFIIILLQTNKYNTVTLQDKICIICIMRLFYYSVTGHLRTISFDTGNAFSGHSMSLCSIFSYGYVPNIP